MKHHPAPFFLTALMIPLVCCPAAIAQQVTLSDAVATALKNNERIHQYEERLKQKNYQNDEAWGNFLPSINLNGGYNHMNAPLEMDLTPVRQAIIGSTLGGMQLMGANAATLTSANAALQKNLPADEFIVQLKKQDFKEGYFLGVQPIFLGGKLLAAKNYASSELHFAEIELKKTQDEVIQETIANYLTVVLLTEVIKTRQNVLTGMEKHRADAQRLLNAGLIAAHQELRAEVAVSEAERNLYDDQNKRILALLALKNTLGFTELEPLDVADSLTFINIPDSLQTFLLQARSSNPILQMVEQKKNAAAQKFNAERAEFLPQVAAYGKYELFPQDLMTSLEPHWVVGINISFNIFNGFKKYSRLESAAHLEREVEFIEADVQKKINLLVHKNYTDMTNSRNRFFKLKSNVSLARENFRLMSNRFQTGLGTSLDVIDAQLIVEKNEIECKTSLFDYYKSMTELYTATGNPQQVLMIWNSKEK